MAPRRSTLVGTTTSFTRQSVDLARQRDHALGRPGDRRHALIRRGSSGGGSNSPASEDPLTDTPESLGFRNVPVLIDTPVPDRCRMGSRPSVRQQIQEVLGTKFQVPRMMLGSLGQFGQDVCEIIVHDQVVPLSTAHDTQQSKTTGRRTLRPIASGRMACSDWLLSIGNRPSDTYRCKASHWLPR